MRRYVVPVVLVTYGDLFELSESLLLLMGWIQDCTFLFIPTSVYGKAIRILSKVDAARKQCLAKDKATQKRLARKMAKHAQRAVSMRNGRRKASAIDRLMRKRALPLEWETTSSTLEAAVSLIRQDTGMPCVLLLG